MSLDLDKIAETLKNMTPEEMEELFPSDKRPVGWISIEDSLPGWYIKDFEQGYTVVKVKDSQGKEWDTQCADHNTWYYRVKEEGATHWWHE